MTDFLQVTTATATPESAAELARSAVAAKLAAGAYVCGPVISFFWHAGEYGDGHEWQAVFKTTTDRYPALEAHLLAAHDWANPEITALPLTAGSQGYLDWIRATTATAPEGNG